MFRNSIKLTLSFNQQVEQLPIHPLLKVPLVVAVMEINIKIDLNGKWLEQDNVFKHELSLLIVYVNDNANYCILVGQILLVPAHLKLDPDARMK